VVITDTTSLNIFKALAAAIRIQQANAPQRKVIVSERDNFPTDLYMIQGMIDLLQQGYELRLIDDSLPLEQALGDDVAVLLLSHVNYRTGAMHDMAGRHRAGASARRAHHLGPGPRRRGGTGGSQWQRGRLCRGLYL
jgi:kynureninase